MDIYWDNKKHKSSTDKNDDKDKDKPDEPRDFIPPLEHTKLHMSNIGVDGNHIYFYSEVSRVRILELNRALIKVNNEMLKKKN